MKYILFFIFSPFLFLGQNSVSLLDSMVLSINRIHSLKYDLKSMELINGKMISNHSMVKLNIKPFRVYSYLFLPEKGIEVLYTEKDNKALVKPNGFPFVNIKLNPLGRIMRNNQHHTLLESGFTNMKEIVLSVIDSIRNDPTNYIIDLGIIKQKKRTYRVLQLINSNFLYEEYVVSKDEDIYSISKSRNICPYLVLVKNKLDFYNDVKVGQKILLPNTYAPKVELWIDLKTYLPLVQKIYSEDDSIFELYEFNNLVINPNFQESEFNKDFKNYGF